MSLLRERAVPALLVWLTTCVLIATLSANSPAVARTIGGALLVLALPGVLVTRAIAGRRRIDGIQLVLFAIGLSIALTALCGLVLNLLPNGITAHRLSNVLGGIALVASVVALVRARAGAPSLRVSHGSWMQLVLVIPALTITALAVILARSGADQEVRATPFSQLYMLPVGESNVLIGIRNRESRATTYRLELSNGTRVLRVQSVPLARGKERRILLNLAGGHRQLRADLTRADNPSVVYRSVHIELP